MVMQFQNGVESATLAAITSFRAPTKGGSAQAVA